MKWHRLHKKKEKMMNAQWKDEILKVIKYQDEDMVAET